MKEVLQKKTNATSRSYCFTLNNPKDDEITKLHAGDYKYITYQRERGDNGTLHLQGFVVFRMPVRLSGAKRRLGSQRYHLEQRRGTVNEAIEYCQKTDTRVPDTTPYVRGVPPAGAGRRSDLSVVAELVEAGASLATIAHDYPAAFIRNHRGIERMRTLVNPPGNRGSVETIVYWGIPGSGKSFKAREENPGAYWWPNAAGQYSYPLGITSDNSETIIIDEFYSWLPFGLLMRLIDPEGYPIQVNAQGHSVSLRTTKVIIISNTDPRDWYNRIPEHRRAALWRRIPNRVHFGREYGAAIL